MYYNYTVDYGDGSGYIKKEQWLVNINHGQMMNTTSEPDKNVICFVVEAWG